ELYNIIKQENFETGKGNEKQADAINPYIENLVKKTKIEKKFKIVINARNGIAGSIAPKVFRAAGMDVTEQFCEIDFNYPNGDANPSINSMLEELGKKVVKNKADIGLAFDADGDRLGITDEKGRTIYPDKFLILLARRVLKDKPGAPIIFDVKSTQALEEDIKKHGGKPIMWLTGHSFIKQKMQALKAPLAGERSGHIFYREGYYGFDDACFAALKLLEYIASEKKPLSKIMKTIPLYYASPVFHAPCPDEIKKEVCERVVQHLKKKFSKVIDIDGARVIFKDGWGLVRLSSNMPVLVLVFEAKTKKSLKAIEKIFRKELSLFPEIGKKWENG
ncbi:MAG: phosphomannomutase/phosphoglucomutase, partial [Candidatus ainarchaeum sp.]|nr:phosphomannomutase/phosphoglucomutase [Candidatus ainarchaeum sp.]